MFQLTTDRHVQCLRYDYIEGSHTPTHHIQFETIFDDLCSLHDSGVVHSDIRKQNFLFSRDGSKHAWMIDFDLAGKPGSRYPTTYNHHEIGECHSEARANQPRKMVHDLHSLRYIINCYLARFPERNRLLDDIKRKMNCSVTMQCMYLFLFSTYIVVFF